MTVRSLRPTAVRAALFCFFLYALLVVRAGSTLTGDEIFYYDQARHLRSFQLVNFQNTQPPLFPMLLAAWPARSVPGLRLSNAALGALAVGLLYAEVERRRGRTAAIVAAALLGLSKFFVHYSVTLHTEPLLIVLTLSAIALRERAVRVPSWGRHLALGATCGLACATKVVGLAVPAFLLVPLLFASPRLRLLPRRAAAACIAAACFAPHVALGGLHFIVEKTTLHRESLPALAELPAHLTLPFVALLVLSVASLPWRWRAELVPHRAMYAFPIGLILLILLPRTTLFARHFLPVLPFLAAWCGSFVAGRVHLAARAGTGILVAASIFTGVRVLPELPRLGANVFYATVPSGCRELRSWSYRDTTVELPFFSQPSKTLHTYAASTHLEERFGYVILEYLDDRLARFRVDGRDHAPEEEPLWMRRGVVALRLDPGFHRFEIDVYNDINNGGIGQVLLCREKELHRQSSLVFPRNELL